MTGHCRHSWSGPQPQAVTNLLSVPADLLFWTFHVNGVIHVHIINFYVRIFYLFVIWRENLSITLFLSFLCLSSFIFKIRFIVLPHMIKAFSAMPALNTICLINHTLLLLFFFIYFTPAQLSKARIKKSQV